MKLSVLLERQPERGTVLGWFYDNRFFVDDEAMKSHLFHEVYGETGTPLGSAYDGWGDIAKLSHGTYMVEDVDVYKVGIDGPWCWWIDMKRVGDFDET